MIAMPPPPAYAPYFMCGSHTVSAASVFGTPMYQNTSEASSVSDAFEMT